VQLQCSDNRFLHVSSTEPPQDLMDWIILCFFVLEICLVLGSYLTAGFYTLASQGRELSSIPGDLMSFMVEEALEQVFILISSVSPANHHSTIALYSSITAHRDVR
jgi:TRAP-type mannitol/chloroaromatic compound transport system permease small subunit